MSDWCNTLEVMRGQGRNDYPVRAMWNALLAGVVFQHPSISALIRELDRNPALLQACGFNVLPVQGKPKVQRVPKEGDPGKPVTAHEAPEAPRRAVPTDWSFSRFLSNVVELEEALGLITEMVGILREQLMEVLPDFGCHLGYDGKAIESHSTGRRNKDTGEPSDPEADWGVHETCRSGFRWQAMAQTQAVVWLRSASDCGHPLRNPGGDAP